MNRVPCTCGHLEAEHRSAGTGFPHPIRFGVCLAEGCDCREYTPAEKQDEERAA